MGNSKQYKGGTTGGVTTGTLSQVLTAGNDGTGQSIVGINSITASILRSVSATNLTVTSDSGGKVIISDNGNLAATSVGVDFTTTGGYIGLKAGAVGGVAIGWAGGQGFYQVSATQIGVSVAGALQMTIDSVIGGIATSVVSELVGGVGVAIMGTGGLFVDKITELNVGNGILISGTGSNAIILDGGATQIAMNPVGNSILVASAFGTIDLTPELGWTLSTGTESKAGINSDDVIYTVGALQNLARAVAAIQNRLISKGYFHT